jgi:DnaK suppressor protein
MNNHNKQTLLAKRNELVEKLAVREDIAVERNSDALDDVQRSAERELLISNLDRDWQTLKLVNAALARMDEGSYGVCERCEEEINPKRLKAIPWAIYCVNCQEMIDQERKLRDSEFSLSDAA